MVCRVVTIFYWRKDIAWVDLSDILNMFVKSAENFLISLLVKSFSSKHEVLLEYSYMILTFIFKKSQLFSLSLTYNLIVASCGHAFFTDTKSQVRRTFQILWKCSWSPQRSSYWPLTKYPNPIMSFILSTSQLFPLFLIYYLIEVSCHSCGHAFFIDANM